MEPVAYLIEGFDGSGKLYAKIVHFTVGEARNSAAEFARHYSTVTTTPLTRAPAGVPVVEVWRDPDTGKTTPKPAPINPLQARAASGVKGPDHG